MGDAVSAMGGFSQQRPWRRFHSQTRRAKNKKRRAGLTPTQRKKELLMRCPLQNTQNPPLAERAGMSYHIPYAAAFWLLCRWIGHRHRLAGVESVCKPSHFLVCYHNTNPIGVQGAFRSLPMGRRGGRNFRPPFCSIFCAGGFLSAVPGGLGRTG